MKLSSAGVALGLTALLAAAWNAETSAAQGARAHNIFLTEARDVSDAQAVNQALGIVVSEAAACRRSGGSAQACACANSGMSRLRSAFDAAVTRHPSWNTDAAVVNFADPTSRGSVALSLAGLARQLEACSKR